jgi:lipopolysaccharide transport system ATP-binding protein
MNTTIKITDVSKMYRLGVVSTGTVSHDLKRWWTMNVMGKEDPYLKVGEKNVRSQKGSSDYVWALQDINIEVEQGEVLGIIGKNGAGKSTLLKLLSRVTKPTKGIITYKGRIASLLEVGTGFHPELTGRENIYMNGSIMGMTRAEITRKLDEIIDFAGVERYIDTPTKRYSSGMTVRLGFSIAAHLEPDILVVDEVLAVGDAEFQKKAIGKMQDVSKGGGRTVLFVSHNMTAIESLCTRGILLRDGKIHSIGNIENVINDYLNTHKSNILSQTWDDIDNAPGNEFIRVKKVCIEIIGNNDIIDVETDFKIKIKFLNLVSNSLVNISLLLYNSMGECIFSLYSPSKILKVNSYEFVLNINKRFLNDGFYYVNCYYVMDTTKVIFFHENILSFEIIEKNRENTLWYGKWLGIVRPTFFEWNFNEN